MNLVGCSVSKHVEIIFFIFNNKGSPFIGVCFLELEESKSKIFLLPES